jgi:hypothetical protein
MILTKKQNSPPFFATPLKDQVYTMISLNDTFVFKFPEMTDIESKKVKLNFLTKLDANMVYNSESNELLMNPTEIGDHLIHVQLEDEDGLTKMDQLKITFQLGSGLKNKN